MDLLRIPDLQALEARAIAQAGPGVLMQRAAKAVARCATQRLRALPVQKPSALPLVLVCMGPGNNGGDALQAGLLLIESGYRVVVLDLFDQVRRPPDAAAVLHVARRTPELSWWTLEQTLAWLGGSASTGLVLDGLFGIGLRRAIEGPSAVLINALNARNCDRIQVLAIDLPSGLNADTGLPIDGGPVVRADLTLTLLANKPGLHTGEAGRWCAEIRLDTIGIDATAFREAGLSPGIGTLFDEAQARPLAPRRARDVHKGRFGDLLVIQGAPSTQGAALLALLGAQAVGAGRLYLGQDTPASAPASHPEFMSRWVRPDYLGPASAIVIGCGLGQDGRAQALLAAVLASPQPCVLDADALNLLARGDSPNPAVALAQTAPLEPLKLAVIELAARSSVQSATQSAAQVDQPHTKGGPRTSRASSDCVMTPHPLEAARLLGCSVQAIQADRIGSAQRIAAHYCCTVVLKGAGTVVADSDGTWSINASGGPLLAVAGTGDVLAGVIGGLLAQGLSAPNAARLGVWLHGAAADALSSRPQWASGIGLPASELAGSIRARVNQLAAPDARCAG